MYIFPECLFNLHYSQKIYKVDSETFVIKKSQIKIDKNNAKYLAFLYALDDYDFLDFNNRIYDYGAWKNYDALKQLLSTLDKNALWYWANFFSYQLKRKLKNIYYVTYILIQLKVLKKME